MTLRSGRLDDFCPACNRACADLDTHECAKWKRSTNSSRGPAPSEVSKTLPARIDTSAARQNATTTSAERGAAAGSETALVAAPVGPSLPTIERVKALPLVSIRLDGGTQARTRIDPEHVERCREALAAKVPLPPVIVYFDGTDHWLADGFHRYHAAHAGGFSELSAEVRPGSLSDAKLYAAGANYAHGLPRRDDDKRCAVLMLLGDGAWASKSDRWIAEHAHVSHPFVAKIRGEATGNALPVAKREGKDGKARKLPTKKAEPQDQSDASALVDAVEARRDAEASREEPDPLLDPRELASRIAEAMRPLEDLYVDWPEGLSCAALMEPVRKLLANLELLEERNAR